MDFSMGLVSAIVTASIFMPFFYAAYLGKQQQKIINKVFKQEIDLFGYSFDDLEQWRNNLIGWDNTHSILVYMRYSSNVLDKQEILISKIVDCNVLVEDRKVRRNGKIDSTLLKVDLRLEISKRKENVIFLNFYDCYGNYMEDHEIARAEKWKKLILRNCTPQRPLKSAA
ncbi:MULTISPECIES: hypothetical protein [Maribacter]|uniref:Uncharacterized protein n=1 Tax=Maribacter flavus TaxID=1658664 RepID=A0A5B2TT94_9FLAO|nr:MULTISPECIES: hypothetical protein [Maribacter]KAA2217423.1 hypothetical protein F0361_15890 [Maribacter flavus]MDC6405731.1 hypothetical protein [Maribacter sp. PR66]MEE1973017.1 hypothetical protein [Maribacter flavus]